MAVNKVILVNPKTEKEETLIDLTIDNSVTEETVLQGETFYKTDGTIGEGKYIPPIEYTLEPLEATENNRTYEPEEENTVYSKVTVKIPTWEGETESLGVATVTITNHKDSIAPMDVVDDVTDLGTIEPETTEEFIVKRGTALFIAPTETDAADPQWVEINKDDTIDVTIGGPTVTLTINGSGAIELKLYDAGADA